MNHYAPTMPRGVWLFHSPRVKSGNATGALFLATDSMLSGNTLLHAVDLRSDTLSMPNEEMLQTITRARLGDDSRDGDPTVRELEALAAAMTGEDAALL